MTEDKLAKLIKWRQKQEKKNDQLRVHKNKIQNDRLKVETDVLESTKAVCHKEYVTKRDELIKMLEKLYARQVSLTEQKKIDQERRLTEARLRKKRQMALDHERELNEQNARKERHGKMASDKARNLLVNKEKEKTFMAKVRTLSAGYKDNDPPLSYYKRRGIIPPERTFTPQMSARAQSAYGGGHRPPSSYEHLMRTPAETTYGLIDEPPKDEPEKPATPEDVIKAVSQVNTMGSTNMNRRRGAVIAGVTSTGQTAAGLVSLKVSGETKKNEVATPAAEGEEEEGEEKDSDNENTAGTTRSSPEPMQRRRANVGMINDASKMMRFGVRPHTTEGGKEGSNKNSRKMKSPNILTNVETERIRKKMLDKSLCLRRERADRVASAASHRAPKISARTTRSATSSDFIMDTYRSRCSSARSTMLPPSTHVRTYFPPKSDHQKKIMVSYINQCRRGMLIPDVSYAKKTLLQASKDHVDDLQKDVKKFVIR